MAHTHTDTEDPSIRCECESNGYIVAPRDFYCDACDLHLCGYQQYTDHVQGKRHCRAMSRQFIGSIASLKKTNSIFSRIIDILRSDKANLAVENMEYLAVHIMEIPGIFNESK